MKKEVELRDVFVDADVGEVLVAGRVHFGGGCVVGGAF